MSSVDDETILEVLRTGDEPRMTTTEVAGQLPVTRGTTRTRLQALADDGLVTREREGRNVVWWLPERADEVGEVPATTDEGETAEPEAADAEDEDEDEAEDEAESEADGDEAEDEAEDDGTEADEEESGDDDVPVEPTEQSKSEREEGVEVEVEPGDGGDPDVTTPDRETETRAEPLPEAPQDDRTIQAVLVLVALAVLYALVRRLRR